jgi:hypothetical protein
VINPALALDASLPTRSGLNGKKLRAVDSPTNSIQTLEELGRCQTVYAFKPLAIGFLKAHPESTLEVAQASLRLEEIGARNGSKLVRCTNNLCVTYGEIDFSDSDGVSSWKKAVDKELGWSVRGKRNGSRKKRRRLR